MNSSICKAEEVLYQFVALLGADWDKAKHEAKYASEEAKLRANRSAHYANDKVEDLQDAAEDTPKDWKGNTANSVEVARERAAAFASLIHSKLSGDR